MESAARVPKLRIVYGPFLSYRGYCRAIAILGPIRDWFYFTADQSRTGPGLTEEGLK